MVQTAYLSRQQALPLTGAVLRSQRRAAVVDPDLTAANWVQLALWMGFCGQAMRAIHVYPMIYHGGRLLIDLAAVVFIFLGFQRILQRRQEWASSRAYMLCYALLTASFVAGVVGLVSHNRFGNWVLVGFLPLMSCSVILVGSSPYLASAVLRTLLGQLQVAVPIAAFVLVVCHPSERLEFHGAFMEGLGKVAARLFFALPFLLPFMSRLQVQHRVVVGLAYVECMALHIIGQNRGPTLLFGVILPLGCAFVAMFRHGTLRYCLIPLRMFAVAMLILAPFIALVGGSVFTHLMQNSAKSTLARISGVHSETDTEDVEVMTTGTFTTSRDEFLSKASRGGEFQDFWSQLEPIDFVCGRGFGGSWFSRFWDREWYMVHMIPGNLILIGGLPLLTTFFVLMLGAWVCTFRVLRHSDVAPGIFGMLLYTCISMWINGDLADSNELYIYWITVGLAFGESYRCRRRREVPPSRGSRLAARA